MDRQRLTELEKQMAKFMPAKQPSNTNNKGNTGFTGKVKELIVPPSSINEFYVNMKNKLIIVPILVLAILWYFKPPQIMNNKNKVKTIDYKILVKYWLVITVIIYIGLFYYYKKYM